VNPDEQGCCSSHAISNRRPRSSTLHPAAYSRAREPRVPAQTDHAWRAGVVAGELAARQRECSPVARELDEEHGEECERTGREGDEDPVEVTERGEHDEDADDEVKLEQIR
jgi:hypothetical protein